MLWSFVFAQRREQYGCEDFVDFHRIFITVYVVSVCAYLYFLLFRFYPFLFSLFLQISDRSCRGFGRFVYVLTINFTSNQMFPRIRIIFNEIYFHILCVRVCVCWIAYNDIYHFPAFNGKEKVRHLHIGHHIYMPIEKRLYAIAKTFLPRITMSRIF